MSLPSASTRLSVQAGTAPASTDLIAVWGPCATLADGVPRLYANTAAMLAAHGYCEAIDYSALHMQDAGKPVLFVPLPIATPGVVGRFNASGNTGWSVVTCAVGASGSLAETDGVLMVVTGGSVGVDQIMLSLSLDGGSTYKPVRLGTSVSYTIPNVGLTVSLSGGPLNAGDTVLTWHSTAPLADFTSLAAPLAAMKTQMRLTRSWLMVGDISDLPSAQGVEATVNAYETSAERYTYAKAQMRDRLPAASLSQVQSRASGTFTASFNGAAHTIARSSGSFVADGFAAGDTIRVSGSTADNGNKGVPTIVAAGLLTFAAGMTEGGPDSGVTITAEPTLTFAAGGETITRNRGSWLADGFRVGDSIAVTGTASNNATLVVTAISATVMTFASGIVNETIGSFGVLIGTGETDQAWAASISALVAPVSTSERVDLGAGRLRKLSPITGYSMRRPVQWADSIRSYQHDIRTTTWWKALGSLQGWGIDGEHDERVSGGLLDARFTCARTWGNGPNGAFIAQSLTRAVDGSILGMTHNVAIASLAQTVCQRATENFAGQVLVLNRPDVNGKRTATVASLAVLEAKVNSELLRNLLSDVGGEGQRASVAKWTAATDDDLGVANATLHGTLDLQLNGTIVHIATTVEVR